MLTSRGIEPRWPGWRDQEIDEESVLGEEQSKKSERGITVEGGRRSGMFW